MVAIHDKYPELRFKDRAITETLGTPTGHRVNPNAGPDDLDGPSSYRLAEMYPNIAEFRKIDTQLFTSKSIMEREWSNLWTKTWLFAGLARDVAAPGDWFVYKIGPESIIIVRGSDNKLRAFYNVCRHRGNRLVREDAGHGQKAFTCGFHSWCWDTKGRNVRVTDKGTFSKEALEGDLSLARVSAEEVGPFVFISMASDSPPIEQYLSGILPTLDSYDIGGMRLVKDVKIQVEANWKIGINAFQETYHAHAQHPQTKLTGDDFHVQFDFYPFGHDRMITPQVVVSPREADRDTVNEPLRDMLVGIGVDPAELGSANDARTAVQRKKRKLGVTNGIDYSRFTDSQLTDIWSGGIFPNVTFSAQPEGMVWMQFLPHASEPEKFIMHVLIFARGPLPLRMQALDGRGEDAIRVPRETAEGGSTGTYEVLEQDIDAIPVVQQGVRSASLPFIRLSEQEGRLQRFYAELDLHLRTNESFP